MQRIAAFLTMTLLMTPTASFAGGEIFPFFQGARMMGMGGASIAVVNDETALLSNPAGLGKVRQSMFTVIDPEVQADTGWAGLGTTDLTALTDPQKLFNALNKPSNYGTHVFEKLSFFPSFVTTNFGFGLYATEQMGGQIDSTGANFQLDYVNDYAAVLGYNFRFFDGRVKLGISGRAIDRTEIHQTVPTSTTSISIASLGREGQGIAADAGLILTGPWEYLPSLAVVARDLGTTSFNLNHGSINSLSGAYPNSVPMTTDVGISISPILSKKTRMQLTAEYQDVSAALNEVNSNQHIHAGLEFNLADLIFLRGGYNQGYWTAGMELDIGNFQMQVASYGEEVGTASASQEDRRYVAKFGLRF